MRVARWVRYSLTLVVVACVAAAVFYWGPPINAKPSEGATSASSDDVLSHLGVVDIGRLVAAHPQSEKLVRVDEEIGYVEQEIQSSGPSQEEITRDIRRQLEAVKTKLVASFEADMGRVKADLDARKASVEGALKAEADSISAQLRSYQDELTRKAGGGPISVGPDAATRRQLQREMDANVSSLNLAAQHKIAARQLEIQQQVDAEMVGAKRKMEQRLADQMDAILRADQSKKLQLQLDVQTATDEEERKKLQEQLQQLNEKEDAQRDALRKELAAESEAQRKAAFDKYRGKLDAYIARVKAERDEQIRSRSAAVLSKYGVSGSGQTTVKSLQAAMAMKQRELKARFEARKNALVADLKHASDVAQERLRTRQRSLEKKLEEEKQRIISEAVKAHGKISKHEQVRRDRLKAQLEELKAQRERIYDGIVAQISDNVRKLADEQQVPLVVGDYRVNIKCKDLTDLALKQAAGSAANGGAPSGQ